MAKRSGGIKIECTKELFNMLSEEKIPDQYDQKKKVLEKGTHTASS